MVNKASAGEIVISPARIFETGLGFWSSKVFLTAVNYSLFTNLATGSKTCEEIRAALNLNGRGVADFLDTLVALRFLHRHGNGSEARYSNTVETDAFLDKAKPTYIGGILEMANNRLYASWGNLENALETGLPQNEVKDNGEGVFEVLYADENRLEAFLKAMAGTQLGNFAQFARQFNFSGYYKHCDIGGAGADLSLQIAFYNPQISSVTFDLPAVAPIAKRNIIQHKLEHRIQVATGDFFADDFPKADIITMGNILHDWNLDEKKALINKAYNALPEGGALVVIENVIDDDRRENVFGLLMSLNMLVETYGGFDYTAADFTGWVKEAGFRRTDIIHLTGPASALVAYK